MIDYSYKLQNVGPVNLTAPYAVSDDKATVTCPQTPTPLVPGAFITCTASHTITQADLDAGFVTNLATGTAKDSVQPFDTVTSNQASATVTAVQQPALVVVKSVDGDRGDGGGPGGAVHVHGDEHRQRDPDQRDGQRPQVHERDQRPDG